MTNENTLAIEDSEPPSTRLIAVVWVLYFLIGILGTLVTRGIVVPDDAATTATNILTHASLYRAGFAIDLVANLIYVWLTALLYRLFRPVNPNLALPAAFFSLAGCTVQIVGELLRIAPTVILANSQLASAFGARQLYAAALLSVTLYKSVFYVSFVLFACFELATGLLILQSAFLPRWLGWWWIAGGLGGLTFLWSPFATSIWPLLLVAGAGEFVLPVWLLVRGAGARARQRAA
ncbi:MAG TPA: DUF4386 domain-containing protein [Gemmatimonadaceae bacterium]